MYLSRIILDRSHPSVRQCLANSGDMHRNVMRLFGASRQEAGVLYRIQDAGRTLRLYVLSEFEPKGTGNGMVIEASRDVTGFEESFSEGGIYGFDLIASPTKKVAREDGGHSRRRTLRTPQERAEWLSRKGAQYGFRVLAVDELGEGSLSAIHGKEKGGRMTMDTVHFTGTLEVTNPELFRQAWRKGIGPGKAYGCGMLLLKSR